MFAIAFLICIFLSKIYYCEPELDLFKKSHITSHFHTPPENHRPAPVAYEALDLSINCQSGFSVRKAKRQHLKSRTKVKFEEVLTNAGGWDSEKDMFIAPCSGIYYFTFNALSENKKDFTLALMKNDLYQVTAYGGKEQYQWASNSALIFLKPHDKVYLELQDGEIYEHPFNEAYTTFTGFLVNKF